MEEIYPPHILARLRHEARTNAYEAGTLSPYRRFTYHKVI